MQRKVILKYENLLIIFGLLSSIYIAFFVTAFTEEGLKSIILIPILLREKNFNEKLDGIIYSIFLSLGFATIENIIYLMKEKSELTFSLGITNFYTISYNVCYNYGILYLKI